MLCSLARGRFCLAAGDVVDDPCNTALRCVVVLFVEKTVLYHPRNKLRNSPTHRCRSFARQCTLFRTLFQHCTLQDGPCRWLMFLTHVLPRGENPHTQREKYNHHRRKNIYNCKTHVQAPHSMLSKTHLKNSIIKNHSTTALLGRGNWSRYQNHCVAHSTPATCPPGCCPRNTQALQQTPARCAQAC